MLKCMHWFQRSACIGSIPQRRQKNAPSINVPLEPGGELNLDQTGMCHRRLKFITLFWSGKTQKGYPALELPLFVLYCIVLYCIVLYCIVLYCIVLYCIVLYCIVLYCIVLYCIVSYCIVLYQRQRSCLHFTYLIK